jgi:hypothetical protein
MIKKYLSFFLLFFPFLSNAQVYHQLSLRYIQSKDQLNNGLLFNGGNLVYQFGIEKATDDAFNGFNTEIGVGVIFRDGLLGIDIGLKPIDFLYALCIYSKNKTKLFLGPKIEASFRGQLYPDLQMGHLLWLTSYSLGPQMIVNHTISEKKYLRFTASSSLLVLTSRRQKIDDHFFSLKFTDIVADLRSKMQFGSFNSFNDTKLTLELIAKGAKRQWAIGYALSILGYTDTPSFQNATHSLTFKRFNKWK